MVLAVGCAPYGRPAETGGDAGYPSGTEGGPGEAARHEATPGEAARHEATPGEAVRHEATPSDGARPSRAPSAAPRAAAAARDYAWVDSLVRVDALERGVPGVAVAIVADGRVLLQRGYGLADVAASRTVEPTTPFNIASVTKPITAALALLLAEEGALRLDDPVGRFLPDLPERYRGITIRQLLTHTSGVDRDLREDNFDDPDAAEYRLRLDTASLHATPGERWEYANAGYTLLGWALAKAAGESLADAYARLLFGPLGVRNAAYRRPLRQDSRRALPYAVEDGETVPAPYVSGGFASGGLSMSISDLANFARALHDDLLLSEDAKRTLWTPATLADGSPVAFEMMAPDASYGMGWFLTRYEGRRLFTHGGGISGYSANLYHFPEEGLSIAVLANAKGRDDGRAPVDLLARAIASECFGRDACGPDGPP